jgi:hypothetical protein
LDQHGWLNFRMRAMIVSFACYNLWLDWKRIAPHLARLFLDFEPGIHYPQLQMQAGTTGINAMRVYNVTKQGKDQDANGKFIRKYVPALSHVPTKFIHEPWRMSHAQQLTFKVSIGDDCSSKPGIHVYPLPIVDEKESAKISKQKMAEVRKLETTHEIARQVYQKHGSRMRRTSDANHPARKKSKSSSQSATSVIRIANFTVMRQAVPPPRNRIDPTQAGPGGGTGETSSKAGPHSSVPSSADNPGIISLVSPNSEKSERPDQSINALISQTPSQLHKSDISKRPYPAKDTKNGITKFLSKTSRTMKDSKRAFQSTQESTKEIINQSKAGRAGWTCATCTFWNERPLAPICELCQSKKL